MFAPHRADSGADREPGWENMAWDTLDPDGFGVVTLGETLVRLTPENIGPLRASSRARLSVAGAESTVAIGVRRLGYASAWIGRLGADEPGRLVVDRLRAERVELAPIPPDAAATGVFFAEQRTGDVGRVTYYRAGSAGSRLGADDVDAAAPLIARARVLHLSGITPALSDTAHAAVVRALELAKRAGITVSFDVNYRSALWERPRATRVLWDVARQADIVFADESELALVGELGSVAELVTKRGAEGASSRVGEVRYEQPAVPVRVVDVVGAGDALVAGYLAGLIAGFGPAERLRLGCLVAGFAVSTAGDWEGLPTRDELGLLDLPPGTTVR